MKKLFSVSYSNAAFDSALLILRVVISIFLIHHGYQKMTNFDEMQYKFMSFLGLGGSISLCLTIFAEVFCSIALILGLLSRLVTVPILINMTVAALLAHSGDLFGKGENAAIYVLIYLVLLILGPGGYSLDAVISKKLNSHA